ncbi:MAG TPA: glycosyl hydrolase, partial [Phycisphaerae bacterium]|nr:glycosyl hydrolase [Phycisphaerae bacterium]
MMRIDERLTAADLAAAARRVFEVALPKILALDARWDAGQGTPVFTVEGRYATRGWTEWTQGFQYGMGVLAFDVTGDERVLTRMRKRIVERMAPHVSHRGVHDHGFNNISTYGNLRRLMREGKIAANVWEMNFYELALKASGAVQAGRWAKPGFIYSFNGPHSLFVDTIRSLRSLAVAHQLGHALMDEGDEKFSLLDRLVEHGMMTAR